MLLSLLLAVVEGVLDGVGRYRTPLLSSVFTLFVFLFNRAFFISF